MFGFKQDIVSFLVKFFFPGPKKDISFYKILSWEKIFIKSPYYGKKKETKKNIPTTCLQPPHPSPSKQKFLENKKKPIFLPWETIKLSPPMPLKKQPLGLVPRPTKNNSFVKGWNYPVLPSSPKKKTLLEKKRIFFPFHPFF